jgi:hypothetical protein
MAEERAWYEKEVSAVGIINDLFTSESTRNAIQNLFLAVSGSVCSLFREGLGLPPTLWCGLLRTGYVSVAIFQCLDSDFNAWTATALYAKFLFKPY